MATGKQIRAIRGAAYDLVSAAVRQSEAESVNPDSKTARRLNGRTAANRIRFETALTALAGKEQNDGEDR